MDPNKIIEGLESGTTNEHDLTVLRGACDQFPDDPGIQEIFDHFKKKVDRIAVSKQLPMFDPQLADAWDILCKWNQKKDGSVT
ncbi:MAG: hypothetical protein V4539_16515 [Bacteroidota bacterium]